eukprot:c15122_g1_i1.p1 GENE.c15122_g1_i1~~c15122_g1_i1.p1  ORF type:complete len:311 (-),score=79.62 c15122_g1_i1:33-896(-)
MADSIRELEHQIGGSHDGESAKGLFASGEVVYKPLQSDNRGDREVEFYESVFALPGPHPLVSFLPKFYGCEDATFQGSVRRFMKLENLVDGLQNPSIMDLKMGTQSFEPGAPPDKVARELAKCPSQLELGFRLTGAKCFQPPSSTTTATPTFKYLDKHFGRALNLSSLTQTLRQDFYSRADGTLTTIPIQATLARVKEITEWFSSQTEYQFFSSSILVCFDGRYKTDPTFVGSGVTEAGVRVRMIDFAHVRRDLGGPDQGYLLGLSVLQKILQGLLEEAANGTDSIN